MNDRQLNYFIITAEERNLGRAAERLPLSISALSRQIQSLEEELGVSLFIRTLSGLELTKAGETLLEHARALRTHFDLTRHAVQRASQVKLEKIDVGCAGSSMLTYVPQLLKAFTGDYPEVEVQLHSAPFTQQLEYLHQGRTLICFDRFSQAPPEFAIELALRDSIVLAVPESHPFAAMQAVDFEDIRDEPMIGRQNENNHPREFRELLKHYGFEPRVVQRAPDMASAVAMVGCGFGLALVPASLRIMQVPNVVYRPLKAITPLPCDLYCIFRKDESSPVLQAMLETVRKLRAVSE
ncbi:LysR family transcriptional regulator [Noviherbaspirillum aerium]|uniref:LysR family transcriptional regulator n=1 Tax=Noviherbaspirillum aerium TaxID=2588497 RepID=UPI00124C6F6E|nr:LysR family transcriptional regulator [Noviherbaspirillum aerium]